MREELTDLPDSILGKCRIRPPERPTETVQGLESLPELALHEQVGIRRTLIEEDAAAPVRVAKGSNC